MFTGIVTDIGEVIAIEKRGDTRLTIATAYDPDGIAIGASIDGTSLTVNEVEGNAFGVNIIPPTQAMTTWGKARPGDRVNVEIDMLARYVARLAETRL